MYLIGVDLVILNQFWNGMMTQCLTIYVIKIFISTDQRNKKQCYIGWNVAFVILNNV